MGEAGSNGESRWWKPGQGVSTIMAHVEIGAYTVGDTGISWWVWIVTQCGPFSAVVVAF